MKWKKWIFLVATGLLVLGLAGCGKAEKVTQHSGKLTIGLEGTYAPFGYRDKTGNLTGYDVEVSKAIAKKMGLKPEFKPTGWDSLIAGLNSNTYDVVFNNMAVTKERKQKFRMADPYVYSKAVIITKDNSDIKTVDDIKGKRFGEGTGTDNWKIAEKYGAKVFSGPQFETAMEMIQQGRMDGAINAEPAFNAWAKSHPNSGLTAHVIPSDKVEEEAIAPLMNKNSAELNKKMNKAIKELRKDGTLKRLSVKYFGSDITNR
ncbi:transporter substrate-binding domain-containing protein [Fructilactobacillus vespulae]|uniref:transporter substrate-binding domain-containing protein n=1 Tax=Fructilactobacillus vespulae TaxID=1249630 RepID=UPI0039B39F36